MARGCRDGGGMVSVGSGFLDPLGKWDVECSACGLIGKGVGIDTAEVMAGQHIEGVLGPLSADPVAGANASGFVPYDGPRRTNGGVECDMAIGPCSCGAWHDDAPVAGAGEGADHD